MKKFALPALLSVAVLASGCATHNVSQPTAPLNGYVDTGLKADVTVGEKISGESNVKILFGLFKLGGSNKYADGVTFGSSASPFGFSGLDPISSAKSAAAYDAVQKSGADVIVAPKYLVDVQDYFLFRDVKVTVSGYKGTINNIK